MYTEVCCVNVKISGLYMTADAFLWCWQWHCGRADGKRAWRPF